MLKRGRKHIFAPQVGLLYRKLLMSVELNVVTWRFHREKKKSMLRIFRVPANGRRMTSIPDAMRDADLARFHIWAMVSNPNVTYYLIEFMEKNLDPINYSV